MGGDRRGEGPADPGAARQRRVRLRPHFRTRRVRPDHRRDDPRSQGRDQPSRPRLPRARPVHPREAHLTEKRLAPGDPAPGFTLPDADGQPVSLSSFRGQRVIVYFYPAAMTPGCTKEACDFRDNLTELNGQGITVGVIRSTFVIDADRKVEKALYGVKATGHVARLMTEVGA